MPRSLKVTNITFYLPIEAKARLNKFAKSQGTSISWILRNFIDNLVKDIKIEEKEGE